MLAKSNFTFVENCVLVSYQQSVNILLMRDKQFGSPVSESME